MNRDFKGVWIPKEIWLNKDLTLLEKIIYIEIDSLDNEDHCIASNKYFAEFCDCSESKVSKAITKLQDLNMLEIIAFDGRHRKMRVVKSATQHSKKCYPAEQKMLPNNIDTDNTNKLVLSDNKKENKKDTIQEVVNWYHNICVSLPKVRSITDKRKKAIQSILNKGYTIDDLEEAFRLAEQSDFMKGDNDRGWVATFDFFFREDKLIAILEGKYGGRKKSRDGLRGTTDSHERKAEIKRRIANGTLERI